MLITGGAGFLGRKLARSLLAAPVLSDGAGRRLEIEELILVDQVPADPPSVPPPPAGVRSPAVETVTGDLDDAARLIAAPDRPVDAVVHLAAVVSAGAEADFDLGYRVNLDGTRAILTACRGLPKPPLFLFASSVAVFGGELPEVVGDDVAARPQSSYGTQKLIGELLVADHARKGMVRGLSLRLPTITVRPGRPNRAASSFASSILREPLQGERAVCPVSADTRMWILSPRRAVEGMRHALLLAEAGAAGHGSLNLPGLTVSVSEMLDALERAGGKEARERVDFVPDPAVEAIVRSWPARFDPARALALGFRPDAGLDEVVGAFIAEDRVVPAG
jgi:D-erythronate 2-dehydrogenase